MDNYKFFGVSALRKVRPMALSQEKAYVKFCEAEENGRHFGQKKCSILILDNLLYFLTLCYFTLIFLLDFQNQL